MDLEVAPTRPGPPPIPPAGLRSGPPARQPGTGRLVTEECGPVRFFGWSSDAGRRVETVRVVLTERGLRASGTIVTLDQRPTSTSYAVLCDAAGRTRRIHVRSESPATERGLSLTRTPGGPWLDGVGRPPPGPDLDDATDAHLSSSVFTLGLAVRRLGLHRTPRPGRTTTVPVAQVSLPDLAVDTTLHRMRTLGPVGGRLRIELTVPAGRARITVDPEGFVVDVDTRAVGPG